MLHTAQALYHNIEVYFYSFGLFDTPHPSASVQRFVKTLWQLIRDEDFDIYDNILYDMLVEHQGLYGACILSHGEYQGFSCFSET